MEPLCVLCYLLYSFFGTEREPVNKFVGPVKMLTSLIKLWDFMFSDFVTKALMALF